MGRFHRQKIIPDGKDLCISYYTLENRDVKV